jgi:cobalt-zinc-cadmium efflux system membrane fusion protein
MLPFSLLRSAACVGGFAMMLAGCGDRAPATPAEAPVEADTIVVSKELAAQLTLALVGNVEVRETLRVASQVKVDEERVTRIGAPVTGRISDIRAQLGSRVQAGEVLATINSTELGQAQLAFLKSASQMQLQSRAVERAKALLAADVIGAAELQRREGELVSAEAEMRAAADQLRVLGMSRGALDKLAATRQINSVTPITATLTGVVIERKVTPGQVVQPADTVFTVADLSVLWVVAEVPEQQSSLIRLGQETQIELPALPTRDIVGRLIFISDIVNPETRTVTIRTQVKNADRGIKPAMLATMLIKSAPVTLLGVPSGAVVRDGAREYVYVQSPQDPQRFRLREVQLGPEYVGNRAVFAGLREGETIVSEGGFHLNNEHKRREQGS